MPNKLPITTSLEIWEKTNTKRKPYYTDPGLDIIWIDENTPIPILYIWDINSRKHVVKTWDKEDIKKFAKDLLTSATDLNLKLAIKKQREQEEEYVKRLKENITYLKNFNNVDKKRTGYIYLGKSNNLFKVGKSINIVNRLKQYTTQNPFGFNVIFSAKVNDIDRCEKEIINSIKKIPAAGKEWFSLTEKNIEKVKRITYKYKTLEDYV